MLIEQPSVLLNKIYPKGLFRKNPEEHSVYLTFDDGPIPEVTPWILDLLDKHGIKATFFVVGNNVQKHPEIFKMITDRVTQQLISIFQRILQKILQRVLEKMHLA